MPRELEREYAEALRAEMEAHRWKWTPETVYLGGGTPSRMDVETLADVLAKVPGKPWREATIEAAPGSLTPEKIRAWREAGISRVSLGVQSFVEKEIRRTGRKHTAEDVAADVKALRAGGIHRINIDLIAGLSGQTPETWEESLDWFERLGAGHASVYMLEVDADSRLGSEILSGGGRYGAHETPREEQTAEFYERAVERLHAMGIERYEISNFARPGEESLHNLKYWRLEPYAGFGADAYSFEDGMRRQNAEMAAEYVERHRQGEPPWVEETGAKPEEERFFVGLRLNEGIVPRAADWSRWEAPIRRFVEEGLLERSGERLRLTPRGVMLSNEVLQEFVAA
jgi:oxygen-independent coproporphyrinogen-3 oxidase